MLKQRLNNVQSCVGATATRAHVESPLRTELFVDSCSVRHQGNCCASTREIRATWISIRTQNTQRCSRESTAAFARHKHTWIALRAQRDMCSGEKTAAFSRREHTWISLRAQKDMFHRKDRCVLTPRAHLDLSPCASKKTCSCDRLLLSHATSTLGSFSVRKKSCTCNNTAAFARCEHSWIALRAQRDMCSGEKTAAFSHRKHTWISLRAQKDMFHRKDRCVLTPRAHLDLSPCASKKTCSCDRLLLSHATSTLGSLSVRKETCSGKTTAAFSRREHNWISFRTQRDIFQQKHCCDLALPPQIDDLLADAKSSF